MAKNYNLVVFFDFDNTIARVDVFDDLVQRFAKDSHWIRLEERWKNGKIGSKECLEGQLKSVGITRKKLDKYLAGIKIDPYFKKVVSFLRSRKIKTTVLSDNFDYFLKRILAHHGIRNLKVYSNRVQFKKDNLTPSFPFRNKKCGACAHCKSKNLLANAPIDNIIMYIGDGRSDICPAQQSDIIFAKDSLAAYCREHGIRYIPFRSLKKVYHYLQRGLA